MFCDPFIFHVARAWLFPKKNSFVEQIRTIFDNAVSTSLIVETSVTAHYRRYFPTYYIKAESEVDVAYIYKNKFLNTTMAKFGLSWRQGVGSIILI